MIKLNGTKVEFESFPNSETLINLSRFADVAFLPTNTITFKYENDVDLIRLLFVKRHLDSLGHSARLNICYMPYSRMDREQDHAVFTLKHIAEFLNTLNFDKVLVAEPHSDVTMALLERSEAVYPSEQLLSAAVWVTGFDKERDVLFFPDAGAAKRYAHITGYLCLVGHKRRNFETGRIESLNLLGYMPSDAKRAIIVDDLCSRGGTFAMSAERLRTAGIDEVYLVTTHCEDTVYDGPLYRRRSTQDKHGDIIERSGVVNGMFTTNSILDRVDHTGLITVFDIESFLC